MIDLYTVPLGATARDFFSAEAENKYSYDEALLVLPSRLLVNHARRSGRAQAVNFEYPVSYTHLTLPTNREV